jgi:hypothetical protein
LEVDGGAAQDLLLAPLRRLTALQVCLTALQMCLTALQVCLTALQVCLTALQLCLTVYSCVCLLDSGPTRMAGSYHVKLR